MPPMSMPPIETLNLTGPSSISSAPVSSNSPGVNPSSPSVPYLPPPQTNDRPNERTRYSKTPSRSMVPLNKPIKPPRYYLAGYVLDNKTTLKLTSAMPDAEISILQLIGGAYPSVDSMREKIQKDLWRKRAKFRVDVELVGSGVPLDTIIATQGGYGLDGSPPEAVEGKPEEIIREWLQDKGISRDEYQWGVRKPNWKT